MSKHSEFEKRLIEEGERREWARYEEREKLKDTKVLSDLYLGDEARELYSLVHSVERAIGVLVLYTEVNQEDIRRALQVYFAGDDRTEKLDRFLAKVKKISVETAHLGQEASDIFSKRDK